MSRSRDITQKGRIAAKSLAHRLTGFSLPFFGVQWTPPADEREIVRGLMTSLEDRRVLFVPHHIEVVSHVTSSVLDTDQNLAGFTRDITRSGFHSRDACSVPPFPGGASARFPQPDAMAWAETPRRRGRQSFILRRAG